MPPRPAVQLQHEDHDQFGCAGPPPTRHPRLSPLGQVNPTPRSGAQATRDHYVGKPAPNGAQQNPITYFKSPLGNRECNCGCGKPINRGDFLPGHDQRAIHERIARVGTVLDFIAWFDQTWRPEQDQQGDAA